MIYKEIILSLILIITQIQFNVDIVLIWEMVHYLNIKKLVILK
jgi:hypothetical protein